MKENYEQFETQLNQEVKKTSIEDSIEAQTAAEEATRAFVKEFTELHGTKPTEVEMMKILKGVKGVLEIDYRDETDPKQKEILQLAIERIESDQGLNEMRAFFETYERPKTPRN